MMLALLKHHSKNHTLVTTMQAWMVFSSRRVHEGWEGKTYETQLSAKSRLVFKQCSLTAKSTKLSVKVKVLTAVWCIQPKKKSWKKSKDRFISAAKKHRNATSPFVGHCC